MKKTRNNPSAAASWMRLVGVAVARYASESNLPTRIALDLNVSSQVVNNWRLRGVSIDGALKAESAYGCSPTWLLTGLVPEGPPPPRPVPAAKQHDGTSTLRYLTSTPWPFSDLDYRRVQALDAEQLARLQLALHAALAAIERPDAAQTAAG